MQENLYDQVMEEFEELRRKHLGVSRSILDKVWVLLNNQQFELEYLREANKEMQRENDIHTAALKNMRGYAKRAIESTADRISKEFKEWSPKCKKYIQKTRIVEECVEKIESICEDVKNDELCL